MSLYPKLHDIIFSIIGGKREINSDVVPWHFGVCSSSAATIAKTATLENFALRDGVRISLQFAADNTGDSPTLNVNGSGAYPIKSCGYAVDATQLRAGRTYDMMFDGSAWEIVGGLADPFPTGAIIPYAVADYVPDGWLICNGALISRTDYAPLFAKIGTKFGAGNGSTTFQLPDSRDKFLEGAGTYDIGAGIGAGAPNVWGYLEARFANNGNIIVSGDERLFTRNTSSSSGISDAVELSSEQLGLMVLEFNANAYNSIYGNARTVQPSAISTEFIIKF